MRTDLRMQIQGDLNRFLELIALMQRMANHEYQGKTSSFPAMVSQYWTDEGTYWESDYDSPETWASDGSWMWVGYDDELQEGSYYEDGADWDGNYDEENGPYHEDEHGGYTEEDYYGGGGQGRGKGRGR
eukprot:4253061-Pyramimonas_sp.AAC.1